jgi:site-specific recombinase XerD
MYIFEIMMYVLKNKSLENVISEFIEECEYKEVSKETIYYYNQNLRYFSNFIRSKKTMLSNY